MMLKSQENTTTKTLAPFLTFEGHKVRMLIINDEPQFVAADISSILGYRQPADAVRGLDPDQRSTHKVRTSRDSNVFRSMVTISESGLYQLILQREAAYVKDPRAHELVHKFQRWVTHEVLPSIRRHGAYLTPETVERLISDPETGIRLLTALKTEQDKRRQAEQQIESDKPYTTFGKALSITDDDIQVGQLAKILRQNGYETGQNRLFKQWLGEKVIYRKVNGQHYEYWPMQRCIDAGWFKMKGRVYVNADGRHESFTLTITPKGQRHFLNKYLHSMPQLPEACDE